MPRPNFEECDDGANTTDRHGKIKGKITLYPFSPLISRSIYLITHPKNSGGAIEWNPASLRLLGKVHCNNIPI